MMAGDLGALAGQGGGELRGMADRGAARARPAFRGARLLPGGPVAVVVPLI